MIEHEPEILTAAPLTGADFVQNGQMSEMNKTFRRQSNPPAAGGSEPVALIGVNPGAPAPVLPAAKRDETPEALFSAAVRSINKRYRPGTLAHIENHFPELDRLITDAFNQLEYIWARTVPDGGLQSFKRALVSWYNLNIQAIEIFEDSTNGK